MSYAGSFLVARPTLRDSNFGQSVVLLLQHDAEGAFGLMVNRPGKVKDFPYPVFFGGPCSMEGMLMLHGQEDWAEEIVPTPGQICPGVFLGDPDTFERVHDAEPWQAVRFKMFSGYSGWGAGQLEKEMNEGSWAVVSADADLLFDVPAEELWMRLAPPAIPQPSMN